MELIPVLVPSGNLLSCPRVLANSGCSVVQDKNISSDVLLLKSETETARLQTPRDDRPISSLQLPHTIATLQVRLGQQDKFALEVVLTHGTAQRSRLVIGTDIKDASREVDAEGRTVERMPLVIPRKKWVQVIFHLAGIVGNIFGLQPIKFIDMVAVSGSARVGRLMVSSSEQVCIDSTPEGMALFAVPAYAPPIWQTARSGSISTSTSPPPVATGPAPDLVTAESKSRTNKALSLTQGHSNSAVPPSRLQPLNEDADGNRRHSSAPQTQPHQPGSSFATLSSGDGGSSRRPTQVQYIRLVEDNEAAPPRQGSHSGAPTRRFLTMDGGGADDIDISGWDEEKPTTPAPKEAKEPKEPKEPKSTTKTRQKSIPGNSANNNSANDERVQRLIASRKRRAPLPTARRRSAADVDSDDEPSSPSPAVLRKRRMRRRVQMMRANEIKQKKQFDAKLLLPSEISVLDNPARELPASEGSDGGTTVLGDVRCGYGFGYMGVLRHDGKFETDENANTALKGALTLELSDDDDDDDGDEE